MMELRKCTVKETYKEVDLNVSYTHYTKDPDTWDITINGIYVNGVDIYTLLSDKDIENIINQIITDQDW